MSWVAGQGAVSPWCCCCVCRYRARLSGTSGPPSPLQKGEERAVTPPFRTGLAAPSSHAPRGGWAGAQVPDSNSELKSSVAVGPWRQALFSLVWPLLSYGNKETKKRLMAFAPGRLTARSRPSPWLLHPLCPHLALTSTGRHVHALLILANGPRFARCPGDEVYNGSICPPAMAPSRGDPSTGPRLYLPPYSNEGHGKGVQEGPKFRSSSVG